MQMEFINQIVILAIFGLLLVMFLGPPVVLGILYFSDRRQKQHAVLRNYPILGRLRYLLEHVGPEFRQYLFSGDLEGKPFTREGYRSIVFAGKYMKTLISFGSKRDFDKPGWYVRNALLPTLLNDMAVEREPRVPTRRYVIEEEGLFTRRERIVDTDVAPWTLGDAFALTLGAGLEQPWDLRGLVGMSAMSYGAMGRNAIQAYSHGLSMARGTWLNTGEGGLSEHHLVGGGDVVFQIGPGSSECAVKRARGAGTPSSGRRGSIRCAASSSSSTRGRRSAGPRRSREGHARDRGPPGRAALAVHRLAESLPDVPQPGRRAGSRGAHARAGRKTGGDQGGRSADPGSLDELAEAMARRGDGPDWITVDGGEGGSGATYQEMADSMGLPVGSGIVEADDALRRHGVRDRVKIIASGKLTSSDRIALALALGADAVAIARGLMISVGCIQAQRCHSNTCPVGVATTDERLMGALVVDEKKWRVLNYVVTLRAGLASLAAAAGLHSPTQFGRQHAVYCDAFGRSYGADELFPQPDPG